MYGKNAVAKARAIEQGYLVNDVWYTIQGEGPWAGRPAIFLRLAGCNLKCFFCDTEFEKGEQMSLDTLAGTLFVAMKEHDCRFIVITGGEPLLQELGYLFEHPVLENAYFQIETAGSVWPTSMNSFNGNRVHIVCSPKTPKVHPEIERWTASWKYIIRAGEVDEEDGLPIMSTQMPGVPQKLYRARGNNIFVQPMDEEDPAQVRCNIAAAVDSSMFHGYRLSIQLHKIAGVP